MDNVSINDNIVKEYILNLLLTKKKILTKTLDKNIYAYILSRFNDSLSIQESIYRILNDIEEKPKCKCGNYLPFNNLHKGYYNHCSQHCAQSDPEVYTKLINKKRQLYGSANNHNKIIETCKNKYGVEYVLQLPEKHKEIKETCKHKYSNENYRNIEKSKQTCLEKYGCEFYLNSDDCKQKTIKKFGVDNYRKTDECKNIVSKYIKEHKKEIQEKKTKTFLDRYGVDNPMKIDNVKNNFDWKKQKEKEYITKKKNHSFNTSKIEIESYNILKEKYNDVIYQYKSKEYPFVCDFYIPSIKLYIECNYHWTHGGHPYKNDNEDNKIIEMWKSKNSKYYINAIECWTKRDVNKRNIAKQNNLNYIEFWNINELYTWIKNN